MTFVRTLLLALVLAAGLCGEALAQGCGPANPNCVVTTAPPGTRNNQAASTAFVQSAIANFVPAAPNWTATGVQNGIFVNTNNFSLSSFFGQLPLPAVGLYSSLTAAVDVPSTSTLLQANGLSGYCRTASTTTLCVGAFGVGLTNAAGGSSWGGNFVASNSPTTGVVNGSGFNFSTVNGVECDTNIMKVGAAAPTGSATCLLISSGSETQPTGNYYGILLQTAGAALKSGIAFQDAVVSNFAIEIGSATTGNGADSMSIVFETRTSGGTPIAGGIFLDPLNNLTSNVSFVSTGAAIQNSPVSGDALLNLVAPASATNQAIVRFFDNSGTAKWFFGKLANNSLALTDVVNANAVALSVSTGGNISLGESGKSVTITGSSFVATGLVTNADLVSASTTVNGVTCTLGSTCSITAAAGIVVGTTTVTGSCTNGFNLFNNSGIVGCQAAGSGNVSNTGTPTNGQMAQWTNATTIQGIAVTGTGNAVLATAPTVSSLTVTTAFTATGLVTNADLVNPSVTVSTATCTLGSTCSPPLVIGTTISGSCTASFILFNNAGVVGCEAGGGNVSNTGSPTNGQFAQWTNATTIQGITLIPLASGGTNANLTASTGGIFYSTASAAAILAGTATASLPLLSGATAAPTWAVISYPASATSGGIPYFSSGTAMASSGLLGAGCIVVGGGAGSTPSTASSTCPTVSSAGAVAIPNTSTSSTPITGALTVSGGMGVVGSINAGGTFHQFGTASNGVTLFEIVGPNTGTAGGAAITVDNVANNHVFLLGNRSAAFGAGSYDATPTIYGTGILSFYSSTTAPANYSTLMTTFATAATSATTGTFQVQGGIAASAASWIAAQLTVSTGAAGIALTLTNTAGSCTHTPTAGSETVSCSSDERLKYGIVDAAPVLASLMQVRVRDYLVRADGSRQTGVIAQEMEAVNPSAVRVGTNDTLMVDAPNPWRLLKAIQELKGDNDNLRSEIEALKTGTR